MSLRGPLVLIASVALVGVTAGACTEPAPQTTTRSPSPSPAPQRMLLPNVVGQNAAIALDLLHRTGFTNVDLNTVDGRIIVLIPENWTVRTQTPPPGQIRQRHTKIVLGCAHNP